MRSRHFEQGNLWIEQYPRMKPRTTGASTLISIPPVAKYSSLVGLEPSQDPSLSYNGPVNL